MRKLLISNMSYKDSILVIQATMMNLRVIEWKIN